MLLVGMKQLKIDEREIDKMMDLFIWRNKWNTIIVSNKSDKIHLQFYNIGKNKGIALQ